MRNKKTCLYCKKSEWCRYRMKERRLIGDTTTIQEDIKLDRDLPWRCGRYCNVNEPDEHANA